MFNGLGMNLGNLSRLSNAETRSISPENVTGEKGKGAMSLDGLAKDCARDLGQGWKISLIFLFSRARLLHWLKLTDPAPFNRYG